MIENFGELLALADRMEPKLRNDFLEILGRIRGATAIRKLEDALRRNDLAAALKVLDIPAKMAKEYQPKLAERLRGLAEDAAKVAALPRGVTGVFDLTNPEVFEYFRKATLNTVLRISQESELAIRAAMRRGFQDGIPVNRLASMIRDRVGLTDFQWQTVERYEKYMAGLADRFEVVSDLSDTAIYKLKRGGVRGVTTLARQGLTDDRIDNLVANYTQRLIRERAETIARTLVIDASNEGQSQLWKQAVRDGALDRDKYMVAWILTPDDRLCPKCAGMEGKTRPIEGSYDNGTPRPTLHPRCRCCEGLVKKSGGLKFS